MDKKYAHHVKELVTIKMRTDGTHVPPVMEKDTSMDNKLNDLVNRATKVLMSNLWKKDFESFTQLILTDMVAYTQRICRPQIDVLDIQDIITIISSPKTNFKA